MNLKTYIRSIFLSVVMLLSAAGAWAQARSVTGIVYETDGKTPLVGAAVILKGTTTGVTTNVDGTYSIQVKSDNDILVFQSLGYASGAYAWQLTDNAKFTQGVSVFGAEDTTLNSESALNVAINEHFGLKVAYNVTWNSEPPESAPEHTDRRTTLSLGYSM